MDDRHYRKLVRLLNSVLTPNQAAQCLVDAVEGIDASDNDNYNDTNNVTIGTKKRSYRRRVLSESLRQQIQLILKQEQHQQQQQQGWGPVIGNTSSSSSSSSKPEHAMIKAVEDALAHAYSIKPRTTGKRKATMTAITSASSSTTTTAKTMTTPKFTGYNVFLKEFALQLKQEQSDVAKGAVGKYVAVAGEAWQALPEEDRQRFRTKANELNNNNNISNNRRLGIAQPSQQTAELSTPTEAVNDGTVEKDMLPDDPKDGALNLDEQLFVLDFWALLLESLQLQVASLTTVGTTRTTRRRRKKSFEIYRLAAPTIPICNVDEDSFLRSRIADKILAAYQDSSFHGASEKARNSQCRVYTKVQHELLWIQIHIGAPRSSSSSSSSLLLDDRYEEDYQDPLPEFLITVLPESSFVAVGSNRPPSRLLDFAPLVLSAMESVLTCSRRSRSSGVAGSYNASDDYSNMPTPFADLVGTHPFDLLQSALSIEAQQQVANRTTKRYSTTSNTNTTTTNNNDNSPSYRLVWECLLPYSIHTVHMASRLLIITTRRSVHVFQKHGRDYRDYATAAQKTLLSLL